MSNETPEPVLCRYCDEAPVIITRVGPRGLLYRVEHQCYGPWTTAEADAVRVWNFDNADDQGLTV